MSTITVKLKKETFSNIILEEIENALKAKSSKRKIIIKEGLANTFTKIAQSGLSSIFGKTADDVVSLTGSKIAGIMMSGAGKDLAAKAAASQLSKEAGSELAAHELKTFLKNLTKECAKEAKRAFDDGLEAGLYRSGDEVIAGVLKRQGGMSARVADAVTEESLVKQANKMLKALSKEAADIIAKRPSISQEELLEQLVKVATKKYPKAARELIDDVGDAAARVGADALHVSRQFAEDLLSKTAAHAVVRVSSATIGELIKELSGAFLKFILRLAYAPLRAFVLALGRFLKETWSVGWASVKTFSSEIWTAFGSLGPGVQAILGTISGSVLLWGAVEWISNWNLQMPFEWKGFTSDEKEEIKKEIVKIQPAAKAAAEELKAPENAEVVEAVGSNTAAVDTLVVDDSNAERIEKEIGDDAGDAGDNDTGPPQAPVGKAAAVSSTTKAKASIGEAAVGGTMFKRNRKVAVAELSVNEKVIGAVIKYHIGSSFVRYVWVPESKKAMAKTARANQFSRYRSFEACIDGVDSLTPTSLDVENLSEPEAMKSFTSP